MSQAVLPGWQKPLKLMQLIITRYMLVTGAWVLDGFCGTGSTSHAAIMLGMSAFAFDIDQAMVQATTFRVEQWRTMHSADEEIASKLTENAAAKGTKRGRDALDGRMDSAQDYQDAEDAETQAQSQRTMTDLLEKAGEDTEEEEEEIQPTLRTEPSTQVDVTIEGQAGDGEHAVQAQAAKAAAIAAMEQDIADSG